LPYSYSIKVTACSLPLSLNSLGSNRRLPTRLATLGHRHQGKPTSEKSAFGNGVSLRDAADADLSSLALSFCTKLKHAAGRLTQLPGSERAWIDVFICREQQGDTSTEIAFNLSPAPAALPALCAFDLSIEFTTDVVVADAIESPDS
jgi:hypothetical protein